MKQPMVESETRDAALILPVSTTLTSFYVPKDTMMDNFSLEIVFHRVFCEESLYNLKFSIRPFIIELSGN